MLFLFKHFYFVLRINSFCSFAPQLWEPSFILLAREKQFSLRSILKLKANPGFWIIFTELCFCINQICPKPNICIHTETPKVGMFFISPSLWLSPRTPTLEQRRRNHAFRDFLCKSWIKSWLKSRGRPRRRWACKAWRGKAQWGYCCGVRTHQKARRGHCGNNDKTEQETKAPIVLLSIESAGQEVQMTQLCKKIFAFDIKFKNDLNFIIHF